MNSQTVPVYYESHQLGQVDISPNGHPSFAYVDAWLATQGAFPISVTMPLDNGTYPQEVIAPWLANLLPEERQLQALSRSLGLTATDTIAILREIGGDTAGALSFAEPSIGEDWRNLSLQDFYHSEPEDALARHLDDLALRPFLAGEDGVRLSLAGGQTKSALAVLGSDGLPKLGLPGPDDMLAIPLHGAPSTVILKPDNPNLPGIVENEAYCLALARRIGITSAEASTMPIGERTALIVARYDRSIRRDGSIRRLHQEDFAQANAVFPVQKYERGTVPGPDLVTILRTGDHLSPRDALSLTDQVIFNILVANTDAHAKNYSMLLSNGPALAPLYDVSSVLPWNHVNQYHAQNIAGRKRKPGDTAGRHWNRIAEETGQSPRGLRLRVQELVDAIVAARVEVIRQIVAQPATTRESVNQVATLIEENALRIAGRLDQS